VRSVGRVDKVTDISFGQLEHRSVTELLLTLLVVEDLYPELEGNILNLGMIFFDALTYVVVRVKINA
jgi:hypothetical protein